MEKPIKNQKYECPTLRWCEHGELGGSKRYFLVSSHKISYNNNIKNVFRQINTKNNRYSLIVNERFGKRDILLIRPNDRSNETIARKAVDM